MSIRLPGVAWIGTIAAQGVVLRDELEEKQLMAVKDIDPGA